MQLSLRLLHLPVDAVAVRREPEPSSPDPASGKTTQDPAADTDFRIDGARRDRRAFVRAGRNRERQTARPRSARILIVDGEPAVAESVRDHLLGRGHTVDLAFTAEEALAAIRQVPRDLVLLDNSMPKIDGVEALRRIRALDHSLAVIVVTGCPEAPPEPQTLKLGACGHVVKPIDFADLDRVTTVALTPRRARATGRDAAQPDTLDSRSSGLA